MSAVAAVWVASVSVLDEQVAGASLDGNSQLPDLDGCRPVAGGVGSNHLAVLVDIQHLQQSKRCLDSIAHLQSCSLTCNNFTISVILKK